VEYDSYLQKVEQRLSESGLEIKRKVSIPPYQLDLVAVKSLVDGLSKSGKMKAFFKGSFRRSFLPKFETAIFITVTQISQVDAENFLDFSSRSTKYVLEDLGVLSRGFIQTDCLVVPVVISENFEEWLKGWIEDTPTKKHFAAFEFPVLISLKDKRMYYCKKTPSWGWGQFSYEYYREFVEKHLAP
jgi:hypothetical protein